MDPFTTSYLSAPLHYQPDSTCNPNDPNCAWNVQTYEHTYHGVESVANATVQSDNTVYARLSLDVGPENIVAMARKLGIRTSPLQAVPSLALGTIGVTPLEMASAYATLAAGGVYSKPMAITKVVLPNGKADTSANWGKPQRERVIPDWVASTVTQVLEQNMLYGTGRARTSPTTPMPASPARRTTTRTPGSTATRRASRRRSGSAIRRARSRC